METLVPGTQVGDFVVEGLLGQGGMGQVYRATQLRLDRPVALKVLAAGFGDDETVTGRFVREASIMRDLEHPGVVPVYDAGNDGGRLYLAMRLMESRTLRDRLADGRLPPADVLRLLDPLADALDHAHSRAVIHRDIKPANILLDSAGRPYLADFGIAKALESASVTVSGQALGTPRYMPPEQATGTVGHRGDLYALACVAFEMLTGSPPFPIDDPVALMFAHAHREPPRASELNPDLPPAVDATFHRALAKQPLDRFGSAAEFVGALRTALDSTGPTVRTLVGAPAPTRPPRTGRRRTWWAVAAVVGVLGASALVAAVLLPGATPPAGSTAAPTTAPTTSSAPPAGLFADPPPTDVALPEPPVAHGALLFGPPLDGTGTGFFDSPGEVLDPAAGAIRHLPGAVELEARSHGAFVYMQLDIPRGFTTYVADLELAVRPGTVARQCMSLRWAVAGELAWYWCLDTTTGQADFRRFADGTMTSIGDPVPVEGLQTGRTVQVTIEVAVDRLTMFLDGRKVSEINDDTVPVAGTLPGLELQSGRGTGLVRIIGLRIWEPA